MTSTMPAINVYRVLVESEAHLIKFLSVHVDKIWGLDFEGTGTNPGCDIMAGFSVAVQTAPNDFEVVYVPVAHKNYTKNVQLSESTIQVLTTHQVNAFSSGYEQKFARRTWGRPLNVIADAKILACMLQYQAYNLSDISEKLGIGGKTISLEKLTNGSFDFSTLNPSADEPLIYATDDAVKCLQVEPLLVELLNEKADQDKYPNWRAIYQLELDTVRILSEVEAKGVPINDEQIPVKVAEYRKNLDSLRDEICKELGVEETLMGYGDFNLNSRADLGPYLFTPKGLNLTPVILTGKKKEPAQSLEHLEILSENHPVIGKIMTWKHLFSVYNRDFCKAESYSKSGRVYPSFKCLGEDAVARIYSEEPALTQFSKEMRELLQPPAGFEIAHWDWSQAEIRLAAIFSGDKNLVDILNSGQDIYKLIAGKVLNKLPEQVTPEERATLKICVLAWLYGTYGYSISINLSISPEAARNLIQRLNDVFPGVAAWYKEQSARQWKSGDAFTMFGRRRSVARQIHTSPSRKEKSRLVRSNVNFILQSTCGGDLLKYVMRNMELKMTGWGEQNAYPFCPVFDAVAYMVPIAKHNEFVALLSQEAEIFIERDLNGNVYPTKNPKADLLNVPMKIEVKWSRENWGAVK